MRIRLLIALGVLAALGLMSKFLEAWVADSLGLEAADLVDASQGAPPARQDHQLVDRQLGFRVSFPGRPLRETLAHGGRQYQHEDPSGAFVVSAHPLPLVPRPDVSLAADVLNAIVTQQPGTRIVQLTPCLEVVGARGFDVLLEQGHDRSAGRYRMRLLASATRYFVLTGSGEDASDARRFIGSFALIEGTQKQGHTS